MDCLNSVFIIEIYKYLFGILSKFNFFSSNLLNQMNSVINFYLVGWFMKNLL